MPVDRHTDKQSENLSSLAEVTNNDAPFISINNSDDTSYRFICIETKKKIVIITELLNQLRAQSHLSAVNTKVFCRDAGVFFMMSNKRKMDMSQAVALACIVFFVNFLQRLKKIESEM